MDHAMARTMAAPWTMLWRAPWRHGLRPVGAQGARAPLKGGLARVMEGAAAKRPPPHVMEGAAAKRPPPYVMEGAAAKRPPLTLRGRRRCGSSTEAAHRTAPARGWARAGTTP
jgi:hypothetical protein